MKRLYTFSATALMVVALLLSCSKEPTPVTPPQDDPQKEEPTPEPLTESHTLLIYMQGNNGLAEFMDNNLQRIMTSFYDVPTERGRVFVFYDRGNYTRLTELYMNDGMAKQQLIEEYATSTSTVDKEFMESVFQQVKDLAPAESYGLILSSHGGGWVPADLYDKYLLGDETRSDAPRIEPMFYGQDDYDCMDIEDLVEAIDVMHFNYIIFDACFMGNVEALYDMRHSTDYIVASPAEVLGSGFPYETMIPMLFERTDHCLKNICEEYMELYEGSSGTVTLVKCSEFDALAAAMRNVVATGDMSKINIDTLQAFDNFSDHLYLDLDNYVEQIATAEALTAFRKAMDNLVVYTNHTNTLFTTTGDDDYITVERSSGLTTYVKQEGCPLTYAAWLDTEWAEAIGAK